MKSKYEMIRLIKAAAKAHCIVKDLLPQITFINRWYTPIPVRVPAHILKNIALPNVTNNLNLVAPKWRLIAATFFRL